MCGWVEAADAVHAVRQELAVPVHAVCSGSLLVTKMRTWSPSTASIVGPGRLAVVAPQMRLHAGRELAHDRLGDEVELLPVAVHAPGQRPAVERDDGLIVGPDSSGRAAAASWPRS